MKVEAFLKKYNKSKKELDENFYRDGRLDLVPVYGKILIYAMCEELDVVNGGYDGVISAEMKWRKVECIKESNFFELTAEKRTQHNCHFNGVTWLYDTEDKQIYIYNNIVTM